MVALCFVFHTVFVQVVVRTREHDYHANMYSLEECVFFVKSYYRTQKNLKEVLHLYGEKFNVPCHNFRIWASSNPSVFLTKNLHPKKITVQAALSVQDLIGPIFIKKNVDGPVYRKILKKEVFLQFTAMKKFLKFWFQQDEATAHTAYLTLDLIETHFKKCVISNVFRSKKGALELAAIQP